LRPKCQLIRQRIAVATASKVVDCFTTHALRTKHNAPLEVYALIAVLDLAYALMDMKPCVANLDVFK